MTRKLGKALNDLGLDELLSNFNSHANVTSYLEAGDSDNEESGQSLQYLPLTALTPGRFQPRQYIDEDALQELVESIQSQGVIQPIIVRRLDQEHYEIIAGERRWRAAQLAGLNKIPAIVRPMSDETAMVLALIENIQRRDLSPIEEAQALLRLLEEFQFTHQEVAEAVGKSRTTITNLLRLLHLNPQVKEMLMNGQLEMGHSRALLSLSEEQQLTAAEQIVTENLSVRETEQWVRELHKSPTHHPSSRKASATNQTALSEQQQEWVAALELMGIKATISPQNGGKGKLIVHYQSSQQLDEILLSLQPSVDIDV